MANAVMNEVCCDCTSTVQYRVANPAALTATPLRQLSIILLVVPLTTANMFCGRMKIASNAYHSIRALRTSHTRRLLSDASVAPQLATKIQIFNGLDEKYRYNRQSDVLVQFASSSVIGADIELNINGTSLDRAWLTAASYTNEQCIQKFIWLIAHLAANSDSTCITSQDYDAFVDQFTERLSVFSENEVLAALQIFAQMPLQKSVN